jgi:hypothetical protein
MTACILVHLNIAPAAVHDSGVEWDVSELCMLYAGMYIGNNDDGCVSVKWKTGVFFLYLDIVCTCTISILLHV